MKHKLLFIVFIITFSTPVFSQKGVKLLLDTLTICEGFSTDLERQYIETDVNVFVYGWYTLTGNKLSSSIVSPGISTTYVLKSFNNGVAYEDSLTIKVRQKPSAEPMNDTTICIGNAVILRMKSFQNVDNIVWRAMPSGVNLSNGASVSPMSTTTYQVNASSLDCPSALITKTVMITVNEVLESSGLKFTTPSISNVCETCEVDLNKSLKHNADSVYFIASSWKTEAQVPVSSPITLPEGVENYVYIGNIDAKLISKNSCGSIERTFTSLTVNLQLIAEACTPTFSFYPSIGTKICPCDSVILTVGNPNYSECLFSYSDIKILSNTALKYNFIDSTTLKTKYSFSFKPNKKTDYDLAVRYRLPSCSKTEKTKKHSPVVIEMKEKCHPSSTFFYCKGDTAELNLKASSVQTILDVQFEAPHANSFKFFSSDSEYWYFHSVDTIMSTTNYKIVYYNVKYKDCDTIRIVRDSVKLQENSRRYCGPNFITQSNYAGGGSIPKTILSCKGDSIKININKYSRAITLKDLAISYNPPGNEKLVKISEDDLNLNFALIVYKSGILNAKIKYDLFGNPMEYDSLGTYVSVYSCPPNIYTGNTFTVGCPGDSLPFHVGLRDNSTSLFYQLDWVGTPMHLEERERDTINVVDKRYYYTAFPMSTGNISANVVYSQGGIKETANVQQLCTVLKTCAPGSKVERASYCVGDTMVFALKMNNPNDSVLSVDWGNHHPYSIDSLKKNNDTLYYKTIACKDTAYPVRITSYNKYGRKIVEYLDTLRVVVYNPPKAFSQDSVFVCSNQAIDLKTLENLYPNPSGVVSVIYPGGGSGIFRPTTDEMWVKVQAKAAYQCAYMNGNPWYEDSIKLLLDGDGPFRLIVNDDTALCQYSSFQLISRASKSTKVTWVRNTSDTLYRDIYANHILYDTIWEKSLVTYKAIATNVCSKYSGVLKIEEFKVDVKKAPLLQIYPEYKACLNDSVQLKVINVNECWPLSLKWTKGKDTLLGLEPFIQFPSMDTLVYQLSGEGKNGCINHVTAKAYPYPLPVVLINGGDSLLCANAIASVPTLLQASGADTYFWSPANEAVSSIQVRPTQATTYTVKGTDKNGCKNTANFHYIIKTVAVAVFDTSVCNESPFVFEADLWDNTTYIWKNKNGDTLSQTRFLSFLSISFSDTGAYKLITSRQGCPNDTTVHIGVIPKPEISIIQADSILCEGSSLNLSVNASPSDFVCWILPNNGGEFNAETYSVLSVDSMQAGKYTFHGRYLGCCDSLSIDVKVYTKTSPIFLHQNSFYCEQDTLRLNVTQPSVDSDIVFRWRTPARSFETENASFAIPNLTKADSGLLWLIVDKVACRDSISKNIEIRNRPLPYLAHKSPYCDSVEVVLQAQNIPSNATCEWQFNNQTIGTSLVLNLGKARQDYNGTYHFAATVDGCPSRWENIDLKVYPLPIIQLNPDYFLCDGDTLILDVERTGGSYLWQDGSRDAKYIVKNGGWYEVKVSENGCSLLGRTYVELRALPKFTLGNDTVICKDELFVLKGPNADYYLWDDGTTSSTKEVLQEGWHSLNVSINECNFTDSIFINIRFCGQFYMPSAFSPNGDGINDYFGPVTKVKAEEIDYRLQIYDKSGVLLFSTENLDEKWDGSYKGKKCHPGTYIYQIRAKDKKDSTPLSKTGSVSIID